MKNSFELEQKIMQCWGITSDIELLYHRITTGQADLENAVKFLQGVKTIYDAKFEDLFEEFERTRKENQ